MIIAAVLLTALFGLTGDLFINQWAKTQALKWIVLSVPMWTLAATMFGLVLRQKHYSFAIAVVVVVLVHSGLALVWDYLIEKVNLSPLQLLGVGAAFVAIVLMEVGGKH